MNILLKKLNYKEGQTMFVLNPPKTFLETAASFLPGMGVRSDIFSHESVGFVMMFATSRTELAGQLQQVFPHLQGDAVVWAVYPKGTSRKFTCDFNRDSSGEIFAPFNMLGVRQISIDDDWSALRFRKMEYIKSVTRKSDF